MRSIKLMAIALLLAATASKALAEETPTKYSCQYNNENYQLVVLEKVSPTLDMAFVKSQHDENLTSIIKHTDGQLQVEVYQKNPATEKAALSLIINLPLGSEVDIDWATETGSFNYIRCNKMI